MIILLAFSVVLGTASCKSEKRLAKKKAAAEYAASIDKAKQDLNDILNENTTLSLSEQEALVRDIKSKNFKDKEIDDLISQAEEKLARDRKNAPVDEPVPGGGKKPADQVKTKEPNAVTLADYFSGIAQASSTSEANMFINEALGLFSSPDVPVLIIISKSEGIIDYDRPTTIRNYLNYLKDTRNNINKVEKITLDGAGKIKELELLKMK